jgi:hypothetical protein
MKFRTRSQSDTASSWRLFTFRLAALLLVVLMCNGGSFAYSVLTHEQIVDMAWSSHIQPLLLKRFPGLSEDQIREAHAYATEALSSRISVTTRSAVENSVISYTTCAAEILFVS